MKVQLTRRDDDLIATIAKARWLTTQQIHAFYFRGVSLNACQKRLRKLASAGFLSGARPSRMETQLWRLGSEGARLLRNRGVGMSPVPKRLPGNRDHFAAINDLRLWFRRKFEPTAKLDFFVAEWELKRGRQLLVIPDALARVSRGDHSLLLALEVDLGTENPATFAHMKLANYQRFQEDVGTSENFYVLVSVRGRPRLKQLIRQLYGRSEAEQFLLADLERLLGGDRDSKVFVSVNGASTDASSPFRSLDELLVSPHRLSSREEGLHASSSYGDVI